MLKFYIVTPHAQRERGKAIDVHILYTCIAIYVYMFVDQKEFEPSPFQGRTSRRIYRRALPLLSPETLSLLSS